MNSQHGFLMGTLNMISRIAIMENAVESQKLVNDLMELLRYFEEDEFVLVETEFRMIKKLCEFYQRRYRDRLHFIIYLPEELKSNFIPKRLIVEYLMNLFEGGAMSSDTQWMIKILAGVQKKKLEIIIENNKKCRIFSVDM